MTWQNPKKDWKAGDAPNSGDLNRVEGNLDVLGRLDRTSAYGVAIGTNAYAVTLDPNPLAYYEGMCIAVKIPNQNTGSSTLNVNGLGAKTIRKQNGNAVSAGNLKAGIIYTMRYDGVNFTLQGEGGEGTAIAGDVLVNKTFTNDQGTFTGTMPNKTGHVTAAGITRSGTTLRLRPEAGYYPGNTLNSVQSADSNFIAANIAEGKSIFGLSGTHKGGWTIMDATAYLTESHTLSGSGATNKIVTVTIPNFISTRSIFFISVGGEITFNHGSYNIMSSGISAYDVTRACETQFYASSYYNQQSRQGVIRVKAPRRSGNTLYIDIDLSCDAYPVTSFSTEFFLFELYVFYQ